MSPLFQAGLNVTAIGMGVVFVLLTLLVFIIKGMSALAHRLGGLPETPESSTGALPAAASTPRHELVSVISAAIAMYRRRG